MCDNHTGDFNNIGDKEMAKYISLTYPNDIVHFDTSTSSYKGFKFVMRENTA